MIQDQYVGFVQLESSIVLHVLTRDGDTPTQAASAPIYRVEGDAGYFNVTGSATQATVNVSGATNANPIVITTSTAHGLNTGMRVTIASVGGNTAANGNWTITVLTSTTFSISATGNGAYTSGGTVATTGVYTVTIAATAANGFEAGKNYTVFVWATVASVARLYAFRFSVT